MAIDPNAIVDSSADLHASVEVGPFAIIGPGCVLGEGCRIGPYTRLVENVRMGRNNRVSSHSALGVEPQDLKYRGEETFLEIGDDNDIREFVTISRGTRTPIAPAGVTRLGDRNVIMAYAHIAHDCRLHDGIIMANAAMIAGHIEIFDEAILGGLAAVHQFVRIGTHAFVGGGSMVVQDVPPFHLANGNRARLFGLNMVGLTRKGFDKTRIAALKRASRALFARTRALDEAIGEIRASGEPGADVALLLEFLRHSKRGVCR
ncbi:MAG: acyl-ACP--UDP-N-acetylglucosamine O-acyltransferase [Myxococcales bacterium]|nr:acyl-ACP--UDP-N-acetylglucosamine O-acyltransferase [Myxococcales bacterium]